MAGVVLLMAVGRVFAGPNAIHFQGRLTDNQGNPIVGDGVGVRFSLFTDKDTGTSVWGPLNQTVTTNAAGLFSTDIGDFPSGFFTDHSDLYLQVEVNDGTAFKTLKPRQRLATVPYAFHAEEIPDNSIVLSKIPDRTITENKIVEHSIGTATVNSSITRYLIPPGMVAMFAGKCPDGWNPFKEMNNRFPIGVETYTGIDGGSTTISGLTTVAAGGHSHTVNEHEHSIPKSVIDHQHLTAFNSAGAVSKDPFGHTDSSAGNFDQYGFAVAVGPKPDGREFEKTSSITSDYKEGNTGPSIPSPLGTSSVSDHTHTISSDGTWLPPYHGVVYCIKE